MVIWEIMVLVTVVWVMMRTLVMVQPSMCQGFLLMPASLGMLVMTSICMAHMLWTKMLMLELYGIDSMVVPTTIQQLIGSSHHTFKSLGLLVLTGIWIIMQFPLIQMQL